MTKKIIGLLFLLGLGLGVATAQNSVIQGFCSVGGQKVLTSGSSSSTLVQASYPKCLVTVFLTGTSNLAPLFTSPTGGVLANPFTANTNASWLAYAATGTGVDVVMSGGTPNPFPAPFTIVDIIPGGGGSGGGGVNQIIAGTNVTISPTNGLGTVTINSSGGGGGGTDCPATTSPGNLICLSFSGTEDAFLNQTTPTSNDGIQNVLTSGMSPNATKNVVTANSNYEPGGGATGFLWEASIFQAGCRQLFTIGMIGGQQGIPCPWLENTALIDYRLDNIGNVIYQPASTVPSWDDKTITAFVDNSSGAGGTWFPRIHESESWSSGKNGTTGLIDSRGADFWNRLNLSAGIDNPWNFFDQEVHDGDSHVLQIFATFDGYNTDGAGEDNFLIRKEADQSTNAWTQQATATTSAGATVIATSVQDGRAYPGDETIAIDSTQASAMFQITNVVPPNTPTAGSWSVTGITLTPDNICTTSTDLSTVPQTYNGVTTPETVTLTGCSISSTLSTSATVCVADHLHTESAVVDSASAGTAVIELRLAHSVGAYISQGPNACGMAEAVANRVGNQSPFPLRDLSRVIGASNSSTLLYSVTGNSVWIPEPVGRFSTLSFPIGTLTRNGSGIVTLALSSPDFNGTYNSLTIKIVATDSSYNGNFQVTETAGITPSLSWSNPGTAGTTTMTAPAYVYVFDVPGSPVLSNEAILYPAATIVYPGNPTNHTVDGTIVIEHNTRLQINAGDEIEDQPSNYMPIGMDHELINTFMPLSGAANSSAHTFSWQGNLPDGAIIYNVNIGGNTSDYQFNGGTKAITATLFNVPATGSPFNSLFTLPAPGPATGVVINIATCGLLACNNPFNIYNVLELLGANGNYDSKWSTNSEQLDEILTLAGGSNVLDESKNPFQWNLRVVSSGSGSPAANMLVSTTDFIATIGNSSSTSTIHQTATGFSFNQPITVPSITPANGFSGTFVAGAVTCTVVSGIVTGCV